MPIGMVSWLPVQRLRAEGAMNTRRAALILTYHRECLDLWLAVGLIINWLNPSQRQSHEQRKMAIVRHQWFSMPIASIIPVKLVSWLGAITVE